MRQVRIQISGPGQGPGKPPGLFTRILLGIIGFIVLVSAAFLGAIFFLVALGLFVIGTLVVSVRLWWIRRQIERALRSSASPGESTRERHGPGARQGHGDVIEGEYLVVDERRDEERRDEAEER